jgi:hypothetical protein
VLHLARGTEDKGLSARRRATRAPRGALGMDDTWLDRELRRRLREELWRAA